MDDESAPEETQSILSIISLMFCPIAPLVAPIEVPPEHKSLLEEAPGDDVPSQS